MPIIRKSIPCSWKAEWNVIPNHMGSKISSQSLTTINATKTSQEVRTKTVRTVKSDIIVDTWEISKILVIRPLLTMLLLKKLCQIVSSLQQIMKKALSQSLILDHQNLDISLWRLTRKAEKELGLIMYWLQRTRVCINHHKNGMLKSIICQGDKIMAKNVIYHRLRSKINQAKLYLWWTKTFQPKTFNQKVSKDKNQPLTLHRFSTQSMPQLQQKEFQTTFTHLSPKNRQAIRTRQQQTNTNRKICSRQEPH